MGKKANVVLGQLYGRPDIERCDLFIDMGYLEWGNRPGKARFTRNIPQMLSGIPAGGHKKCGLHKQAGYFDHQFSTIFVNDPYVEKWKATGRPPPHPRAGPWVPCHPAEIHSTPGDNYGTFTKKSDYKAFSPLTKSTGKKGKEPVNFLTNPGKKGNCGYVDICINKYPPHSVDGKVDAYNAASDLCKQKWKTHKKLILNGPLKAGFYPRNFDENPYRVLSIGPYYVQPKERVHGKSRGAFYPPATPKMPGNNHDGCFTKFPEWAPEPYLTAEEAEQRLKKSPKSEKIWHPEPRGKTFYTVSVVNNKVDVACNERTWRTMKPITYPQYNL